MVCACGKRLHYALFSCNTGAFSFSFVTESVIYVSTSHTQISVLPFYCRLQVVILNLEDGQKLCISSIIIVKAHLDWTLSVKSIIGQDIMLCVRDNF